jgi:GMP synthase (glutamine-hydrolysing)
MRPIAIVKTGTTVPDVAARRGDFEDWITAGLGGDPSRIRVVRVDRGDALPEPEELAGIVVTGSSAMVSNREAWSEAAAHWLRRAVVAHTPILGICYGHQLLAHALGGRVAPNPRGREIGTVDVSLTDAAKHDPLLAGFPPRFSAHVSHVEAVLELPAEATLLASTSLDSNHAFRAGENAWGIQFHPEFDADIVRGYLVARRAEIESEGIDVDALHRRVVDTAVASTVLKRFRALLGS